MTDNQLYAIGWVCVAIMAVLISSSVAKCTASNHKISTAHKIAQMQKYTPNDLLKQEKLKIKKQFLERVQGTTYDQMRHDLLKVIEDGSIDKFLDMEEQ